MRWRTSSMSWRAALSWRITPSARTTGCWITATSRCGSWISFRKTDDWRAATRIFSILTCCASAGRSWKTTHAPGVLSSVFVAITEIGKERGNNLELKEVKKGADDTNQKNDLFNSWLKMCRHSATVDNFPFIKVFTDEQRPESWGADARDLADIINIASCGELRLALPLYTIEELISEWAFNRFMRLYEGLPLPPRRQHASGAYLQKCCRMVLAEKTCAFTTALDIRYSKSRKERGTMDGKTENKKYYLMNAKIYAQRFSTDCFSDLLPTILLGAAMSGLWTI